MALPIFKTDYQPTTWVGQLINQSISQRVAQDRLAFDRDRSQRMEALELLQRQQYDRNLDLQERRLGIDLRQEQREGQMSDFVLGLMGGRPGAASPQPTIPFTSDGQPASVAPTGDAPPVVEQAGPPDPRLPVLPPVMPEQAGPPAPVQSLADPNTGVLTQMPSARGVTSALLDQPQTPAAPGAQLAGMEGFEPSFNFRIPGGGSVHLARPREKSYTPPILSAEDASKFRALLKERANRERSDQPFEYLTPGPGGQMIEEKGSIKPDKVEKPLIWDSPTDPEIQDFLKTNPDWEVVPKSGVGYVARERPEKKVFSSMEEANLWLSQNPDAAATHQVSPIGPNNIRLEKKPELAESRKVDIAEAKEIRMAEAKASDDLIEAEEQVNLLEKQKAMLDPKSDEYDELRQMADFKIAEATAKRNAAQRKLDGLKKKDGDDTAPGLARAETPTVTAVLSDDRFWNAPPSKRSQVLGDLVSESPSIDPETKQTVDALKSQFDTRAEIANHPLWKDAVVALDALDRDFIKKQISGVEQPMDAATYQQQTEKIQQAVQQGAIRAKELEAFGNEAMRLREEEKKFNVPASFESYSDPEGVHDYFRGRRKELREKYGVTPEQSKQAIDNWHRINFAGQYKDREFTVADNGELNVNPRFLWDDKKYAEVVEKSDATTAEKKARLAKLPAEQAAAAFSVARGLDIADNGFKIPGNPFIIRSGIWPEPQTDQQRADLQEYQLEVAGAVKDWLTNHPKDAKLGLAIMTGIRQAQVSGTGLAAMLGFKKAQEATDWLQGQQQSLAAASQAAGAGFWSRFTSGAIGMAPALALGAVTGIGGAAVGFGAQTAGSSYAEDRTRIAEQSPEMAQGDVDTLARMTAMTKGAIDAAIVTGVGPRGFMSMFASPTKAGAKAWLGNVLKQTGIGTAEMDSFTIAHHIVDKMTGDPDATFEQLQEELKEATLQGLAFSLPLAALHGRAAKATTPAERGERPPPLGESDPVAKPTIETKQLETPEVTREVEKAAELAAEITGREPAPVAPKTTTEIEQELQAIWPNLSEGERRVALREPFTPEMRRKYDSLPEEKRIAIDQWFEGNQERISRHADAGWLQDRLDRLSRSADDKDPAAFAEELTDIMRAIDNRPKAERQAAKQQAFEAAGEVASSRGMPVEDVKRAVASEFSKIYGSDAAEMAGHIFGGISTKAPLKIVEPPTTTPDADAITSPEGIPAYSPPGSREGVRVENTEGQKAAEVRPDVEAASEAEVISAKPSFGESNKIFTKDKAEQARKNLLAKLGRASMGIDPTLLGDAIQFGGYILEGGIREFSAWSNEMVKQLGEGIRGHTKQIYESLRSDPSTSDFAKELTPAEMLAEPPTAPTAPAPSDSPTGIRNAIVDRERVARGMPPRMAPLRREFQKAWDDAMVMIDADPAAGSKLVEEIRADPRPLFDWENALLAHEQVTREHVFDTAVDAVNKATDPAVKRDAEVKLDRARDELQLFYDAEQQAGTEQGRGLAARKILVHQDYSLARMEAVTRAVVNKGEPLSKEQAAEVKELHDLIAKAESKIADYEAREKAAEAENVFNTLIREFKKEAKEVAKSGGKFTNFLDDQAAKAKQRIIARRGRLNMTVDPLNVAGLVDEAIIGASHIAKGVTKFADWSSRMVSDFGDRIKPYLTELFERAKAYHDSNSKLFEQSKSAPKIPTRESLLSSIKSGQPLDPALVYDLARAHVRAGTEGMEAVIEAVHKDLLPFHEGLTERDVRDAFSGYGKTKFPSKEEDLVKLREYRNLARMTSQLEDVMRKIPPLKTGPQRDKATAAMRILQKRVNDAMRKMGIVRRTPEEELKSSLDAAKTRLRNEIEELDAAIASRTPRPTNKSVLEYDAEAKALKEQRDAKLAEYHEIFERPERTPEERVKAALKALDKSIAEEEQMLREGILKRPARESKTPFSQKIEDRRLELDALRRLRKELYELENPKKTPDEIQLARDKKAIATRTKQLQERIAKGDYAPRAKRTPLIDAEKTALLYAYAKAKEAYTRGLFEAKLKQRSTRRKIFEGGRDSLNTARAIMTGLDLSAVLRQGGFIVFGHPIRSMKSIPAMFRAFRSEQGQFAVNEEIKSRPNAQLYKQAKLYLADLSEINLTRMEEAFMSRWAHKIPIVAGSQRAYITFLNRLRADSFDAMVATLSKNGTPTLEEARAVANFVNVATGRGNIGWNQAAVGLNTAFFAPRYVASRFQLLAGQPFYGGTGRTRALIAKEYARTLIGAAVVYALGTMFQNEDDAKIVTDPTEADFLKIRFGDTRLDPLFGLLQSTVISAKVGSHAYDQMLDFLNIKNAPKKKFGEGGPPADIGRFLRTKLSPLFGTTLDVVTGENVIGEKVTPLTGARNLVVPISFGEIAEAMQKEGVSRGTALGMLAIFGMGLQTYNTKKSQLSKSLKRAFAK